MKAGPWFEEAVRRGLIRPEQPFPRSAPVPVAELPADLSEKAFQAHIVARAESHGWLCFHPFDSRRSKAGYPDLTMVRYGVLIFAELKVKANKTTAAQERWLDALAAVPGARVRRWRPEHWPAIVAELTEGVA